MQKVMVTVLGILIASFVLVQTSFAADLSDKQRIKIGDNCPTAQSTLQRISSSDTTARINRGRDYDQVLKLLYAMNTRVASNNIAEPKLAELTKDFQDTLNDFRNDYNKYNDQLKNTYEIDCKNNVDTFYDSLTKTRESRTTVRNDITKLDNIINDYKKIVSELVK